jgi:hypothetical protein
MRALDERELGRTKGHAEPFLAGVAELDWP